MKKIAIAATLLIFTAHFVAADDSRVTYPENYRDTFVNYLSLDRTQNPDQIIRLFANEIAMQGVDESGELPDGSILVGEVYAAAKNSEGNVIESNLGRRIATKLALVAVMEKRDSWEESSSSTINVGDWDFGAFAPSGFDAGKDLDSCRACHSPLVDSDHLFSKDHIPEDASSEND